MELFHALGDGASPTWTIPISGHGQQFEFASSVTTSHYQVPIDVTAGWAVSPVHTRSPFIQLEQCE